MASAQSPKTKSKEGAGRGDWPERFDPLDPTIVDHFLEEVDAIRDRHPVSWNPSSPERRATENNRWDGFWMLSSYEDVSAAALDWRRYSAAEGACPVQYDLDVQRLVPLETDPPLHRDIR